MNRAVIAILSVVATPSWASSQAFDPDPIDRGFLISQMGPVLRLPDQKVRTDGPNSVQFDTDSCGALQKIEGARSRLKQGDYPDDGDDWDDEDDPLDDAANMIASWLSSHPEIAVTNGAIDKWCGKDDFDDLDQDSLDIA